MQNELASGQAPVFTSVRTEAGKARVKSAVAGFQARPEQVQPSIPERIASVKERYDPRAISPQDIDQMFDALVQAGHPVTAQMLLLNSMGEKFRSRLAGITGSAYDGSKPLDLVGVAQLQIQRARKQGSSAGGWETFLAFLAPQAPSQAQPQAQAQAGGQTPLDQMARIAQQAQARPH